MIELAAPVRVISGEMSDEEKACVMLQQELKSTGGSPQYVFQWLCTITESRMWERMPASKSGERFGSFTEFVECPQPYGLGMAVDDFKKLLEVKTHEELKFKGGTKTAKHFADMRANVRRLLAEDVRPVAAHGSIGNGRSRVRGTNSTAEKTDTADYITARLKRDDPELAEKVIAGEITPNAAAREKGWRKPRILVSSPAATASALVRHLDREQVAELISHLQAELEGPEQ